MSTTTLLTFEEFERLPAEPGKMELLDSELIRLPPQIKRHVKLSHRLREIVCTAPGLGEAYIEMGYKIGSRNWLQPNVSIEHANQPEDDYSEGAPALAIEVISESNTAEQVDYKVKTYLANWGIEVWVVYPKTRCVWLFRQGHAEEFRNVLISELLPELRIDLRELFG